MCGWSARYATLAQADQGAKYHAEDWCQASKAPPVEGLSCYFCGQTFLDFDTLSEHVKRGCEKERNRMNVGQWVGQAAAQRLPLLDGKLFKKLETGGKVKGKMLACRAINSPKFHGLAMDFKNGRTKFSFLARFDRFDIGALCLQTKSEETDDWLGQTIKFITKQGEKGVFVNVWNPKSKKAKRGRPPKS